MKISNLEELRGIAAISVTLFHCCFASNHLPHNSYFSQFAQFGDKGVQVFFILSGFVIPWSLSFRPYNLGLIIEFLQRRFLRIQLPYSIALILTLAGFSHFNDDKWQPGAETVLSNFLYLVPLTTHTWIVEVAWSLGVEVQFYLLTAICFPFFVSNVPLIRRLSLIFLICMALISIPTSINSWYLFPMWAPFFGIGISFFLFLSKRVTKREYFITYALIIIFVYLKYTHLLTITCICTSIFFHFCRSIKLPSILTYFGKISYSLYLIHLPIIFTVGQILQHVNIIKIHPNLSVIILMLTAILSSIPFYYLIEKPSLLWAKKLKKD